MGQRILNSDSAAQKESSSSRKDRYCTVDQFHASLNESLIYLGPHAKRVHGLDDGREKFGIAEVIRYYNAASKPQLLGFFEKVGPNCTTLDFRSTVELASGHVAEVHWVGNLDTDGSRINGVIVITEMARFSGLDDEKVH